MIHASEIPYVYGDPVSTASSVALSSSMMNYWISFADSLDPNDGRGVQSSSRTTSGHNTITDIMHVRTLLAAIRRLRFSTFNSRYPINHNLVVVFVQIIMEFGEEAYTIQDDYRKVQIEFLNSVPTVLAN